MSYNNSGGNRDKPNTGVLFTNDRKQTDRHPDMTGYLLFDTDVVEALIKSHRAGMPMKLQISGWLGRSNRGTDYVSMRFGVRDTPIARDQGQSGSLSQGSQPMQQPRTIQPPPLSQPRSFGQPAPQRQAPQQSPLEDDAMPF